MYYYKVYGKNGIEYIETTEPINKDNAILLTADEYYTILEKLIEETLTWKEF